MAWWARWKPPTPIWTTPGVTWLRSYAGSATRSLQYFSVRALSGCGGLAGKAGARLGGEGEDVIRVHVEGDLLSRRRWLAPLGPRYHQVVILSQPHVQQGVRAELFHQHHLAGQLP